MNCECVYVLKEQTMESAHKFAERINKYGEDREIYPISIAKITRPTHMTTDYDNWCSPYIVKPGTLVVFVGGKLHNMVEIKPWGAKRGFPDRERLDSFDGWFEDLELFD